MSLGTSHYKENRESIFLTSFGRSPESRVIDLFLDNPLFDLSRKEIIEALGMAKVTLYRVLPLINIDNLLYHRDTLQKDSENQFVVVVGLAEKKYGIKVDDLIGQKEIVIKSLGKYLGNIEGVAGSTIMGDGAVVMIADIGEIVNKLIG